MEDFWIEQGWFKSMRGGIRLTRAKWQDDPTVQNEAVKFLIEEVLKIDPRNLTLEHFFSNRLKGLIGNYHNSSPFSAISKVYPEINAWEMIVTPFHYFNEESNRIVATKWLVEQKLKKDPRDITAADFTKNRLWELLAQHNNSPYAAISEAYPKIKQWEMPVTPYNYFDEKANRVAAIKWLAEERLKKDPRDVTADDFANSRLSGLLVVHYTSSPYAAIHETYPEINTWEMKVKPNNYFDDKSNRVAAVKWLAEQKLKKDPRDLTPEDFRDNRLGGLYDKFSHNLYSAIQEAYSEIRAWEMLITPSSYFDDKSNRITAVRWLVEEKLKKDPREICGDDFRANRLPGLLSHNFRNSPYLAIREAYPEIKPFEMINRPKHI